MDKSKTILKTLSEGAGALLNRIFDNPYKKAGLTWFTLRKLKYFPKKGINSVQLFGKENFFYDRTEYLHAIKEIFEDEIYLQHLPPNAYIIDCGAHIGLSVIFLMKLCPSSKIIAFEPDPINFEVLKKNIESQGFVSCELKNEAVWTNNTTVSFVSDGNMSSKIGTNQGAAIDVQATRLRDFLTRRVDFLKLDIEGAEFEVMQDISDKLSLIENLFIEYHGAFRQNNQLNEMLDMVTKNGFQYYIKEATSVYNHPFLRESSAKSYDIQLNIFCFRV